MPKNKKELAPGEKPENIMRLYRERLSALKRAREYSLKGDVPRAVERYKYYLNSLATYHNTTEEKLKPELFDPKKELSELLLISHAYWDLAKAFDRSPKLQKEAQRFLDQFVKFTIGYKYQHVNSRMLKKFIRQKVAHHPQAFNLALDKIKTETGSCFIATHCFGEHHHVTNELRLFKKTIAPTTLGLNFIRVYYDVSPAIVDFFQRFPVSTSPLTALLKVVLRFLSFSHRFLRK